MSHKESMEHARDHTEFRGLSKLLSVL